jgi:hypothetical protein
MIAQRLLQARNIVRNSVRKLREAHSPRSPRRRTLHDTGGADATAFYDTTQPYFSDEDRKQVDAFIKSISKLSAEGDDEVKGISSNN